MLMIGLTFITGAYYERNVFYKLENVTIEIGEKLPEDILNFIGVINESKNFSIETNAKLDNEGHVMSLGTYSYYLVYNDEKYKFSRLTNVKATITVIDTKKPVITINDQNELVAKKETTTIENTIWDGEGLLDKSIFDKYGYENKGMLLLRNRYFKSCVFNTNLQTISKFHCSV